MAARRKGREIASSVERLQPCLRCKHLPCPCCEVWCDHVECDEEGDPEMCACGDEGRCEYGPESARVNQRIYDWIHSVTGRTGLGFTIAVSRDGRVTIERSRRTH